MPPVTRASLRRSIKSKHSPMEISKGRKRHALGDISNKNGVSRTSRRAMKSKQKVDLPIETKEEKPFSYFQEKYGSEDTPELHAFDRPRLGLHKFATRYVHNITMHNRELETTSDFRPIHNYMSHQKDLNEKMRELLLDWLNQVHLKFELEQSTYFLGVMLLDRFLSKVEVKRKNLQLVGSVCLWMASKYEDIWAPEMRDFVAVSDNAFSLNDMLNAERAIFEHLGRNIRAPHSWFFMLRLQTVAKISVRLKHLSNMIIEMAQQKLRFVRYNPSLLASCALALSFEIENYNVDTNEENLMPMSPRSHTGKQNWRWTSMLERSIGYSKEEVMASPCFEELGEMMIASTTCQYTSVAKKYSHSQFYRVAKMEFLLERDEMDLASMDQMSETE